MTIQVDTREHAKAIKRILAEFDKQNVIYFHSKLPVGDYMNLDNPRVVVDRKQNLSELCGNVCQQHERFRSELELANKLGIKLTILCEHGGAIKSLEDVAKWQNPRLKISPLAVSGERLYRILKRMGEKYNVDFVFCTKAQTGAELIRLLGGNHGVAV